MSFCLVWGRGCVSPPQTGIVSAVGPQKTGGARDDGLSHYVSCSSCGPPRANWAAGDSPALGPGRRLKPSSAPILPGKRPPLRCGVEGTSSQGKTLTHPLTRPLPLGLHPHRKKERERVWKWAALTSPARQNVASQMPVLGGTVPLCPVEVWSISLSLEAIFFLS